MRISFQHIVFTGDRHTLQFSVQINRHLLQRKMKYLLLLFVSFSPSTHNLLRKREKDTNLKPMHLLSIIVLKQTEHQLSNKPPKCHSVHTQCTAFFICYFFVPIQRKKGANHANVPLCNVTTCRTSLAVRQIEEKVILSDLSLTQVIQIILFFLLKTFYSI